jgi:hypothetical protein
MKIQNVPEKASLAMTSVDNDISMALELLTSYLLDGNLMFDGVANTFELPIPDLPSAPIRINFPIGLCPSQTGHFTDFWYDPTFTALFSGTTPTELTQEGTPAQKKSNKTTAIAVGVSLGAVALLAALIIVLVVFFPSVRTIFQPFYKRGREARRFQTVASRTTIEASDSSINPGSTWTRSSNSHS